MRDKGNNVGGRRFGEARREPVQSGVARRRRRPGRCPGPDFRAIGPRGFILTKEDWLAKHRTGDLKYEAFERSEITVRTYGDAAIMTSRESTKAFYKGREVPGGDYRATHVFVRQEGRWRLAGIHLSPILPGI